MRKKCLVTGYMNLNVGDDLFFDILFDRYKNVDFYFFPPSVLLKKYKQMFKKRKNVIFYDQNVEYKRIREDITDENIPINLFPMICECAQKTDFYLIIGGSIFIQNENWESDDRFIIKKIIGNKPSFIIGSNFGPADDNYKKFFEKWFKEFDDVCFRDNASYELFKKLNNIRKADDIVLSKKKKNTVHSNKRIGISVIDLSARKNLKQYEEAYITWHANIIKKYLSQGFFITLYSFCNNEGDLDAINKIIIRLTEKEKAKIKIVSYDGNLNSFLKKFSINKYIIGSRLHSILLSILFKQNFIPISYSDKIKNILIDMGDNKNLIDITKGDLIFDEIKFHYINKKFNSNQQFKVIDNYINGKETK